MTYLIDTAKQIYHESLQLIHSPGKFEGANIITPYFYDLAMEGEWIDEYRIASGTYLIISISPHDRTIFPDELEGKDYVVVFIDKNGFVDAFAWDEREYERGIQDLQLEQLDEDYC